jgi:hypothetical protein
VVPAQAENSKQEAVPAQEKTRHSCLFLRTAVCWTSQAFPAHRMRTVKQHVHEVATTPFTTNKGILIGIHKQLNTQAPSSPIPKHQATKMYWEVEAKLHTLLT